MHRIPNQVNISAATAQEKHKVKTAETSNGYRNNDNNRLIRFIPGGMHDWKNTSAKSVMSDIRQTLIYFFFEVVLFI